MADGEVKGFALEGEYVAGLIDKHFEIIEPAPVYELSKDLDNPTKQKEKLIITIKLSNGQETRWYANKTSQKVIMREKGFKLIDWIGFKGEFYMADQMINNIMKKVIYCKSAKPIIEKV